MGRTVVFLVAGARRESDAGVCLHSMIGRQAVINAVVSYLRTHPDELSRVVRNALGLRFGVPIEGLQWLAGQAGGGEKGPQDIVIEADPPGIRVSATVDMMGAPVRATTSIFVERIRASSDELKVEIRLEGTRLDVMDHRVESPVTALIRSGALDLTKSGSLAAHLPQLGSLLGESAGNRLVIDLLKHPKVGKNKAIRRVLSVVSSIITIHGVESDDGHLDVQLRALPRGLGGAARAVRDHLLTEGPPWFSGMLPGRRQESSRPGF